MSSAISQPRPCVCAFCSRVAILSAAGVPRDRSLQLTVRTVRSEVVRDGDRAARSEDRDGDRTTRTEDRDGDRAARTEDRRGYFRDGDRAARTEDRYRNRAARTEDRDGYNRDFEGWLDDFSHDYDRDKYHQSCSR